MINIYATGMNPADANALKRSPRVALFQAVDAMIERIRQDGNVVTWQRHKVGEIEEIKDVDAVLVSVMLPRSLNCPYALGAIDAIAWALEFNKPLVIYLTDWAFFRANSEFKSIAKAGRDYFFKQIGGAPQYNEDPHWVDWRAEAMLDVCRMWNDPNSNLWQRAEVLVPKYTNLGNIDIIQALVPTNKPVLPMDPTPAFVRYLHPVSDERLRDMEDRIQSWILPSLLKDDTWLEKQHLGWPVERFGPKGFTVLEDERAVHRRYQEHVGALCPPYPTAGSGWWRSRWIHAARARTVLLCDRADALMVNPAYDYSGWQYEHMDTVQLRRIAEDQREMLFRTLQLEMDVFGNQIMKAFRRAGA